MLLKLPFNGIRRSRFNHSGEPFQKDAISMSEFTGLVWTKGQFVSKKKKKRKEMMIVALLTLLPKDIFW